MKQFYEFPDIIQKAAIDYVSAYFRDSSFRDGHLRFMRFLDNSSTSNAKELAECIDAALFDHYMAEDEQNLAESLNYHADHEYWLAFE